MAISRANMNQQITKPGQKKKVGKVMREFKEGTLHSGKSGPVVKNPKQAIAIAMSEAKMPMRGSRTAKNMKTRGMK